MKNAAKCALIGLLTAGCVLVVMIPLALPPVIRHLVENRLTALGYPSLFQLNLGYNWNNGPLIVGDLRLALRNTPWLAHAEFAAGFGHWHAEVNLPKTRFSESDPLVARLLREHPITAVSNLVFSGSVALNASVERTHDMPVPVWKISVPLRDVSARCLSKGKEYAFESLSVTPTVSGIVRHVDIEPAAVRIDTLSANGFNLTNLTATLRVSEKALMITSARANVCGGQVNLYSAFLDPKNLDAGLTLFLENVDAGQILTHLQGFRGSASGRLHGKVRLFLRKGGASLHLSNAFLYSTPGEIGKLKMENPEILSDNLALAGLDDKTRNNVANALTDMDFSVMRLDLRRTAEKTATLAIRVDGSATRNDVTVPVNINININGELEQLINTSLGYTQKLKGKQK